MFSFGRSYLGAAEWIALGSDLIASSTMLGLSRGQYYKERFTDRLPYAEFSEGESRQVRRARERHLAKKGR